MKKSINGWTFASSMPLADAARLAREAGFEALEPVLGTEGEITPSTDEDTCKHLGEVIRQTGLEVASLACGLFWETSYTSPDAAVRQQAYDLTIACLDRARWLGAPVLLVVPGVVARVKNARLETGYENALAWSYQAMQKLIYEAEARHVVIAIENVWNQFLISPVEMREFVDRLHSGWLGIYFDVGNVLRYGIPQDWIQTLGRRIARVHLKDYRLGEDNSGGFCSLGEGSVDWPAVMSALESIGYDGPLTYEGSGDLADISRRIDRVCGTSS